MTATRKVSITSQAASSEWVDIVIPTAVANDLQRECIMQPQGWRAVRGGSIGIHGQVYSVQAADMVPGVRYTGTLESVSDDRIPLLNTDWVGDDPLALQIQAEVVWGAGPSAGTPVILRPDILTPSDISGGRQIWHSRATVDGLTLEVWATVYHLQDIVDWEALLTWSDYNVPELEKPCEKVNLRCVEPMSIDYQKRDGYTNPTPLGGFWRTRVLTNENLDHGVSMPFSGRIAATPQNDPSGNWMQQASRIARMQDSITGRAWGISHDWQDNWLSTGLIPSPTGGLDEDNRIQAFLSDMQRAVGPFAARPRGMAKNTGTTGGQEDFAAAKGYGCAVADPLWIAEMEYSGRAAGLRFFHFKNDDGSRRWLDEQVPRVITWNLEPDGRNGDLMGKSARGWGNRNGSNGWTGIDEEHYSTNTRMAWHALSGSNIAQAFALDELSAVLAEKEGRTGAARAFGRRLHAWGNLHKLLPATERVKIKAHAEQLISYQSGQSYSGEEIWPISVTEDPRRLDGQPAWAPWEHSFAVLGLSVWEEPELTARFAKMVVRYGIYEGYDSHFHAVSAVRYLKDGDEVPSRDGLSSTTAKEGDPVPDYLYPDPAWCETYDTFRTWMLPAVLIAHDLGIEVPRCEAILRDWWPDGVTTWGLAEWAACGGGWPR